MISFLVLLLFALFIFLINWEQNLVNRINFVIAIFGVIVLLIFIIHKYGKLKAIELIVENSILKLNTHIVKDISQEVKLNRVETTDLYISYFGILFEDRIVRFNQKGIQLKSVEIGPDYFSFTYGKGKQLENIKFIRPFIEPAVIEDFSKSIYFETGIQTILKID